MTSLFSILPRYMSRNFLWNFLFLLSLLLFVVLVFDSVELLKRSNRYDLPLTTVFKMALFKLPEVGQIILPFAILFSAMYTFWRLNRTSELAVMRSIGLSAMQFTFPILITAFGLGILAVTVINPISSVLLRNYEKMENKNFGHGESPISISKSGLWLRQNHEDGEFSLLNAARLNPENWQIEDIILLEFNEDHDLLRRIQADKGYLKQGYWLLNDTKVFKNQPLSEQTDSLKIQTELTPQDIIDTFSSIENISFWKIPEFINTLRATGFSTTRMEVYYQSLIARPFFFAAMVLLAAAVSLRPSRQGGIIPLIIIGVMVGFILFFSNSLLQALGISQNIPVFLAAWTPTIVSILLGGSVILQQEDG